MVRLPDGGTLTHLIPSRYRLRVSLRNMSPPCSNCCAQGKWPGSKGSSPNRAVQVAERFVRAGLTVSVTPALNVQTLVHDDRCELSCLQRTCAPDRGSKCPACGVYVDKITPSLRKRKNARDRERKAERESRQRSTPKIVCEKGCHFPAHLRRSRWRL